MQFLALPFYAVLLSLWYGTMVQANPAHNELLSLSERERASTLAALLANKGEQCRKVKRTFYQGSDKTGNAFWNAECVEGPAYVIQVSNDSQGSTRILECGVLRDVKAGICFIRFK